MITNIKWTSTPTHNIDITNYDNDDIEQQIYNKAYLIYKEYMELDMTTMHKELLVLGLCDTIKDALLWFKRPNMEINEENFPMLFTYKPPITYLLKPKFWYSPYREEGGHLIRFAILEALIK